MKESTPENIFHLLNAFIHETKPVLNTPDWDEIFYYADIHSIRGIIGYMCTKYSLCEEPKTALRAEKAMISVYGMQYRRREQMKRLIAMLNENEIDHILMKGYIVKDIYPIPELRSYGDIDFVIRKEDRMKTDTLMKQNDYNIGHDWEPVYSYKKDTEFYEIHTQILDDEIADGNQIEYFCDVWDHIQRINGHSYRMKEEYHFTYLIAHLAKHASARGAGLRMYLDIALYIERCRNTLDWVQIQKELEVLKLDRFFNSVCCLCETWFDVKPPVSVNSLDEKTIEMFTDVTFSGGIFGFQNTDVGLSKLKEIQKEYSPKDKISLVFTQLFPSADKIKARYTYLQKQRWLLPVAWIDRLLRNRRLLSERVETMKEIVTADEEEVRKIRNLYQKIGL